MKKVYFISVLLWMIQVKTLTVHGQSSITIPSGSEITVDGVFQEEEWSDAKSYEEDDKMVYLKKNDKYLYIGLPIKSHLQITSENAKSKLTFIEITINDGKEWKVLHASSMNGDKLYGEASFTWGPFELWEANSDAIMVNGKNQTCEGYEFKISQSSFPRKEAWVSISYLPFYTESFQIKTLPLNNSQKEITNWIYIKF